MVFESVAELTLAVIDLITIEVILTGLFDIRGGRIKFRLENLISDLVPFRKTSTYVVSFILIGISYFYVSNTVHTEAVRMIASTGWQSILLLIASVSFVILWTTKVAIGRDWDFHLVKHSAIISVLTFIAFILVK